MRVQLVMVVAVVCAAAIADADPAKAKAANNRGYALHKKKKYKEAAVEYRSAIAEDQTFLLAHYNLACIASLTKDSDTAIKELEWVVDRAVWDPAAKAAATKIKTDRDLKWVRDYDGGGGQPGVVDSLLMMGNNGDLADASGLAAGKANTDAKLAKAVAAASGRHDDKCNGTVFSATINAHAIAASLRDGVALVDGTGKVNARSEPLGCTTPQDHVTLVEEFRSAMSGNNADRDLRDSGVVIVESSSGSKQNATIFVINKKNELSRAFDGVIKSDAGDGVLTRTAVMGNLVYAAPGEKKKRVFRWDGASSKFVEEK